MAPLKKVNWDWDMFGGGHIVFHFVDDVSWWQRLVTKILFRSKWSIRPPGHQFNPPNNP